MIYMLRIKYFGKFFILFLEVLLMASDDPGREILHELEVVGSHQYGVAVGGQLV